MLISPPRPTQMLHFGRFALPSEKQGSVKRDLIRRSRDQRSHALPPGLSQLATSFIAYQAESFPNRRLCTITRYTIFFFFTIAAPETLREHFRKATIFTLSVITLTSWHISCNPIHDGHCGFCSATSFIPCKKQGTAYTVFRSYEHPNINPLHKVALTVKLRR